MKNPELLILLSGKRKCGKDYIAGLIQNVLDIDKTQIIRISEPIKKHWATKNSLNLNDLLSDGPYKEKYRKEMIEWSDQVRLENSGFFCDEAFKTIDKPIVIVSDIRRKTDISYFKSHNIPVITVRIESTEDTRKERGWHFQAGVDDVASECDLDDYLEFSIKLKNDKADDLNLNDLHAKINEFI